jgi:hypothetical protein
MCRAVSGRDVVQRKQTQIQLTSEAKERSSAPKILWAKWPTRNPYYFFESFTSYSPLTSCSLIGLRARIDRLCRDWRSGWGRSRCWTQPRYPPWPNSTRRPWFRAGWRHRLRKTAGGSFQDVTLLTTTKYNHSSSKANDLFRVARIIVYHTSHPTHCTIFKNQGFLEIKSLLRPFAKSIDMDIK